MNKCTIALEQKKIEADSFVQKLNPFSKPWGDQYFKGIQSVDISFYFTLYSSRIAKIMLFYSYRLGNM